MSAGDAVAVRSRDEVASSIRAFTDAQWARLHLVARKYARRYGLTPEDLLQEACCRALESDGRKCPVHVDVVKFLAEAMRSIADGEVDKAENRVVHLPIVNHTLQVDGGVDPPAPPLTAEEGLVEAQALEAQRREVLGLFDDDQHAREIVEGIMADFSGDELRELVGLDQTTYASKRRLIRRRIDKHYTQDGGHDRKE